MTEITPDQLLLLHSTFDIRHSAFPLAFSFITPAFAIIGLLAVSIPIIIHLLNRRRYKEQQWAAMQFLLAAMRKNRRRLKFEQWILLATRCALVALLGLALARPLGCADSAIGRLAGRSAAMHVIVIDNSYSMAYQADRPDAPTHLDQARKLARQLVDGLSSGGDSVVLITASQPATAVIAKPSYDLVGVLASIDRVSQRMVGTDLAGALAIAEQLAREEAGQPNRTLHLFSDATTSAWRNGQEKALETLGQQLAEQYAIRHYNLSLPSQSNAAVLDVSPGSNLVRTRFANDFRAVVRSYGASVESGVLWKLGDETLPGGSAITIDQQTPPITQSNAQLRAGGSAVVSAQIVADDRLKVDNARYHAIEVASEMKLLIVEGRRGMSQMDGSGAFLELALAPPTLDTQPGRTTTSYLKPERISDIELAGKVLGEYRAILLADVAQLAAPVADQLAAYVKQGGTVVWFQGDQVQREAYNGILVPRGLLPGPLTQRQSGAGYAFNFSPTGNNHPLLNAFKGVDRSGLETAQVFTYWQIAPKEDLRVENVLTFQSTSASAADPAMTLHRLGEGKVVFFASSADAEWTSFPAKPAYVTLMHEIVAGTVAGSERFMNLTVGQRIEIPTTRELGGVPTLHNADTNADEPLVQVTRSDGSAVYQSPPMEKPGVFRLNAGKVSWPVAVNVPADEADVRPLSDEAIRTALGNVEVATLGAELPGEAESEEEGRDFGWALMAIVLALLGFECFMAMRFGHYRKGAAATK